MGLVFGGQLAEAVEHILDLVGDLGGTAPELL
jgi:hypothetical protein